WCEAKQRAVEAEGQVLQGEGRSPGDSDERQGGGTDRPVDPWGRGCKSRQPERASACPGRSAREAHHVDRVITNGPTAPPEQRQRGERVVNAARGRPEDCGEALRHREDLRPDREGEQALL